MQEDHLEVNAMEPRYASYSQMASLCVLFLTAAGLGFVMIVKLRRKCQSFKNITTLAFIPLISPVISFVVLNILAKFGHITLMGADGFSFGFLIGIVYALSMKPKGQNTHKLIVKQLNGSTSEVWLDSENMKVGDVRNIIARGLNITPASCVCIESGKGRILEDMSGDFFAFNNTFTSDFFGFNVSSCYITITDSPDEDIAEGSAAIKDGIVIAKKRTSTFMSLLNTKGEAKFGVELTIIAKVPYASSNAAPFYINPIDMFAAAAPSQHTHMMRIVKWDATMDKDTGVSGADGTNEDWESGSNTGSSTPVRGPGGKIVPATGHNESGIDLRSSGQPIRHGDIVVVECEGKYMSVARGWWMKWSSPIPRRSGAFVIEIIEKAPQVSIYMHWYAGVFIFIDVCRIS